MVSYYNLPYVYKRKSKIGNLSKPNRNICRKERLITINIRNSIYNSNRFINKDSNFGSNTRNANYNNSIFKALEMRNYKLLETKLQAVSYKSFYSTHMSDLTHVDDKGKAHMVDVCDKAITVRTARAEATVYVGEKASELIQKNLMKKGDVLTVAQIAGIMGAKKTSELIPLCHNINLSQVKLELKLEPDSCNILINSYVKCEGKTGVEMEALTGVTIAALTIYDMCKAIDKGIVIHNVRLLEKRGGKSGNYSASLN